MEGAAEDSHELVPRARDDPREVAGHVHHDVDESRGRNGQRDQLVEVDVVVERDDAAEKRRPELGESSPADGEEDERHVELEGLGGAFGQAEAPAHDLVRRSVLILVVLPGEEDDVDCDPQSDHPNPLPVLKDELLSCGEESAQRGSVSSGNHGFGESLCFL